MNSRLRELGSIGLAVVVLATGFLVLRRGARASRDIEREAWEVIRVRAGRDGIDAGFVYSLAAAESGFDPHAQRGQARGMLQLTPKAWASVSKVPYPGAVWEWRINLEVGIDRLAALKADLVRRGVFSYRMLFAAYHYGTPYLAARNFDLRHIPHPPGAIARRLGPANCIRPPRRGEAMLRLRT